MMKKTYQIKINQGKESKTFDIVQGGVKGQALTLKAVEGARYQLVDKETTYGPENIRTSRIGKDLHISFEGSNTTDVVIEDYYKATPEGFNGLIGEAETGKFYEYIPENASGMASVPMLTHSGQVVGMALGGAEVASSGAAVGVLAAGLFSPWLLGAGAVGLAAAGGGGGGSSSAAVVTPDTTKPTGQTGALAAASDSGAKDNVTNVTKPVIEGVAEANAKVSVSLKDDNGVVSGPYTATADANGKYSVTITDTLVDASPYTKGTQFTPLIKVTDAAGNFSEVLGTPFKVDTSVPNISVNINNDTNNNGKISLLENADPTKIKVQSSVGSQYVNVGDQIFAKYGDKTSSHTITQTDIDSAVTTGIVSHIFEFVASIVDKLSVAVTSWFVDLLGNDGSASKQIATDSAVVDLTATVSIKSIAVDNIVNIDETKIGSSVLIKGFSTATGVVNLYSSNNTIIGSATVQPDGSWSSNAVNGSLLAIAGSVKAKIASVEASLNYSVDSKLDFDTSATFVDPEGTSKGKFSFELGGDGGAYRVVTSGTDFGNWKAVKSVPIVEEFSIRSGFSYEIADLAGNNVKNISGGVSDNAHVVVGAVNSSSAIVNLKLSDLISSDWFQSPVVSIKDVNSLSVGSVDLTSSGASVSDNFRLSSLDVLNHGVNNLFGLGVNPQIKINGNSADAVYLTNIFNENSGGGWSKDDSFVDSQYNNYTAYALGVEVDVLVDKSVVVHLV